MKLRATLLVAVLCALFTGQAWATDFTLSSAAVVTQDGITVSFAKGSGSTAPTWYAAGLRLYASNKITISSSSNITGITFNWEKQGNKDFASATANVGTYTHPSAAGTGTWSGSATSVTFTIGSSGQLQLNTLSVTTSGGTTLLTNDLTLNETEYEFDLANGAEQTFQLTNSGSADGALSYQSDNTAVATVSNTGLITAVSDGTARITVTQEATSTYNGGTAYCDVTVIDSRYTISTLTFTGSYGSNGATTKSDDNDPNSSSVTWTVSSDGSESSYDSGKGIHYGTGSAAVEYITLSTSDINGTIKKVVVNASTANNVSATVGVTVGGSAFGGDAQSLSSTATNYTFNAASTAKGQIIVTVTKPSSATGALYVKSVTIYYEPSTDPAISASDVDITYDATSGSIDYTLENATGNVSATVTTGNWLTLGTITADEVPFTCAANTGAERTATVTLSFSGADDKVVTVTQAASPARYTTISDLFTGATSTATNVLVTFDDWVVSGVSTNGKNIFVTDNAGNGFVIYSNSDQSSTYAVGNILSGTAVPCSLKLNSGYAQLTSLDASDLTITTGGTVSAANVAMSSLAGVNTGALVSYENLTCTVSGTTYTLTDGTTTIQLYTSLYNYTTNPDFESGHKYNVTGIYQQYGETKELLPRSSVDIVEVFTPAIAATPASLTGFTYEVDNGPSTTKTISVSGSNLTADITLSLGNNSDFEMSTTEGSSFTNSLTLTQSAGAVAATTVYVRMKSGLAIGNSYSGTITLTSTGADNASVSLSGSVTAPVVDYATLPFSYDSDAKTANLVDGLTQSGITGYYGSSPKIKLDNTDDYVILKLNEAPGVLSFDIKGMGTGTWSGTFDVLTSTDGVDYSTTLQQYTSLSTSAASREVFTLSSSVRYIKWVFTSKTSGFNVALGRIVVEKPNVTLNTNGYATYTSNSAIDYSQASGYTAWAITGISGETITFSQVTGAVPAGTGVLLMGTAGQVVAPVATTSGTAPTTNLLEGITIATTVAADAYYGLKDNEFKKVYAGTVPAGKALLPASEVPNEVKSFTFVFESADGIKTVEQVSAREAAEIFNLAGQRMSKMQRGVNIVNGKKVLVK